MVGVKEFIEGMAQKGIAIESKKMRLSTGWKSAMGAAPPVSVLVIPSSLAQERINAAKTKRS